MRKSLIMGLFVMSALVLSACQAEQEVADENGNSQVSQSTAATEMVTQYNTSQEDLELPKTEENDNKEVERAGGISPENALEKMKTTDNLVIVEVNAPEWKLSTGFTNAMYIPYTEMEKRYDEIPKDRPVLLHCGGGIVSQDAYKILTEKRPDIPWLGYIAGAPMVSEYNEWLERQEK